MAIKIVTMILGHSSPLAVWGSLDTNRIHLCNDGAGGHVSGDEVTPPLRMGPPERIRVW